MQRSSHINTYTPWLEGTVAMHGVLSHLLQWLCMVFHHTCYSGYAWCFITPITWAHFETAEIWRTDMATNSRKNEVAFSVPLLHYALTQYWSPSQLTHLPGSVPLPSYPSYLEVWGKSGQWFWGWAKQCKCISQHYNMKKNADFGNLLPKGLKYHLPNRRQGAQSLQIQYNNFSDDNSSNSSSSDDEEDDNSSSSSSSDDEETVSFTLIQHNILIKAYLWLKQPHMYNCMSCFVLILGISL